MDLVLYWAGNTSELIWPRSEVSGYNVNAPHSFYPPSYIKLINLMCNMICKLFSDLLKMAFLYQSDGIVSEGYANFQKLVRMTIRCISLGSGFF